MDETSLRALLERALAPEPPIGPVANNSLRAGIKLRRRRRMRAAAGGAAVIAVIAIGIPVVTGALGHRRPPYRNDSAGGDRLRPP
jgi:hypothetical protein